MSWSCRRRLAAPAWWCRLEGLRPGQRAARASCRLPAGRAFRGVWVPGNAGAAVCVPVRGEDDGMQSAVEPSDVELARAERERRKLRLAIVRDGQLLVTGERGGVADLLEALRRPEVDLAGASLSDRVVGRAAAMLARCAGIAAVQAGVLSEPAAEALAAGGIAYSAERRVPRILNRTGDDLCPLERLSLEQSDPQECRRAVEAFVAAMASRPPSSEPSV
jgi:hypothetical protein